MSVSSNSPLLANQLPISLEMPEDPGLLRQYLELWLKRVSTSVNTKEGALYQPQELATFQNYFGTTASVADPAVLLRPTYRMVVNFGALPNTATSNALHNIAFTTAFQLTRMYGAATDPTNRLYLPLPYAHPTAANSIAIDADATKVYVTTGSNRSAYTVCTIVLEYTKTL